MQFGNFVKIISSFTHWIFQDSSMYSNQPLESEMQKIFVTKSLLSNPFLESTFPSKKSSQMGSQKQSVGFLKITYGNRELYKVAKIKLMFTRVFDCKTKNLLMSEKT